MDNLDKLILDEGIEDLPYELQELIDNQEWEEAMNVFEKPSSNAGLYAIYCTLTDEKTNEQKSGYIRFDENKNKAADIDKHFYIVTATDLISYWERIEANKILAKLSKDKNFTGELKSYLDITKQSSNVVMDAFIDKYFQGREAFVESNDIRSMLYTWIKQLGFSEDTNPFLSFLSFYFEQNNKKLSLHALKIINNLFAKGIIDGDDLKANTPDSVESILFNPTLYLDNNSFDDIKKIIQTYIFFSNKSNIDLYIKDTDFRSKHNNFASDTDVKKFRDSIIFEQDGKTIRQASNITNRIKELEKLNINKSNIDNNSKNSDYYSDADDDIEEPIVVKEKARWDKLDLKKLKPKEINDLIAYLKSIGKIK